MNEQSTETEVRALSQAWVKAEVAGDGEALDRLTVDDFTFVGPAGFVLVKQQWVSRYGGGTFSTSELTYDDVQVRIYGDSAVSVGVHTQKATFQGNPADGSFRGTHIAVREDGRWRLAGMQLSPIGGPPPFRPRPETEQG